MHLLNHQKEKEQQSWLKEMYMTITRLVIWKIKLEPMKPAPPVTIMVKLVGIKTTSLLKHYF